MSSYVESVGHTEETESSDMETHVPVIKVPEKYSKMLVFAYWFSKQLGSHDQSEVYSNLGLFESVEHQISVIESFNREFKTVRKEYMSIQKNRGAPSLKRTRKTKTKTKVSDEDADFINNAVDIATSSTIPDMTGTFVKKDKPRGKRVGGDTSNTVLNILRSDTADASSESETSEDSSSTIVIQKNGESVVETVVEKKVSKTMTMTMMASQVKVSKPSATASAAASVDGELSSTDEARVLELCGNEYTGQQLRDFICGLRGKPVGQKSISGTKNKKELAILIVSLEKQNDIKSKVSTPIALQKVIKPSSSLSESEMEKVDAESEMEKVDAESEMEKVDAESEKVDAESEMVDAEIDLDDLTPFELDGVEYLKDKDENIFTSDGPEHIGKYINGRIVLFEE